MNDTSSHSTHCAANGCPCEASMTRSTTGTEKGGEWWCPHHFYAAPGRTHEITAELRRFDWLVQLCKGVRHYINSNVWAPEAQAAHREIALHQRSDLYQRAGGGSVPYETWPKYLLRLEAELEKVCQPPKDTQQPLAV